jgi:hypothetical protein
MDNTSRKNEIASGTLLFDFEIRPSPDDYKNLAERLQVIEQKGKASSDSSSPSMWVPEKL